MQKVEGTERTYRGQPFRFFMADGLAVERPLSRACDIAQNQHYFAFVTITFSLILCWVGSNRSGPCGDLIEDL
jgi:hypothetical protein